MTGEKKVHLGMQPSFTFTNEKTLGGSFVLFSRSKPQLGRSKGDVLVAVAKVPHSLAGPPNGLTSGHSR